MSPSNRRYFCVADVISARAKTLTTGIAPSTFAVLSHAIRRHGRAPRFHAAKHARSCGCRKSTGVPLGMIPVGLTRVIE
jgi:hypothetical protein